MKESIKNKLMTLAEHHEELGALLGEADVINNQEKFKNLSKEYAELEPIVQLFAHYNRVLEAEKSAKEFLAEADEEMREMAEEELDQLEKRIPELETELNLL